MITSPKWMGAKHALLACVPIGALAGAVLGYSLSSWSWGGPSHWLVNRSDDALGCAVVGAVLLVAVVYLFLYRRWPAKRTSIRAAPRRPSGRTQPPPDGGMRAANSNGKFAQAS
jgi:hypothetical protein